MPLLDSEEASNLANELIRGATTELRKPVGEIPTYKGTDLSGVKREVGRASNTRDSTNKTIDEERGNFGSATEREKAGLDAEAAAKGDAARADQERAQQVANTYQDIGKLMGITLDPNSEAAILAKEITKSRPEADARLKEITDMADADNPLDWLVSQFVLPGKVEAYNAVAARINGMQNSLDETISTAEHLASYSSKGIPTITAAQAKATADKATAEATVKKANADEAMAKTNVSFAVQKLSGDMAIAEQTEKMTKLQQAENELMYKSQINAIQLADTHANRMLKAAQLIETLQEKKGLEVIIRNYDRIMGHPEGTTNLYIWKNFKEEQRQNIVAIGAGSLGSDPFTGMVNFYASKPGPEVSPETLRLMSWLKEKSEPISTQLKRTGISGKEALPELGKQLRTQVQLEVDDAATRPSNLFHELNPARMIASGAVPADSQLAKILEPLAKTDGPVPTDMVIKTIMASAGDDVNTAGAMIASYYKKNIELRNSVMNTSLLGVKLPTEYVYRDGYGPLNLMQGRFDLTKPEQATKYILFQKQKEQAFKMRSGVGKFG